MDIIKKLNELLCGKTIIAIDHDGASESIARFTMSDGVRFRLHATELGAWIERTSNVNEIYISLGDLLEDYSKHYSALGEDYNWDVPNAKIKIADNILELKAPDGRLFKGQIDKFVSNDQAVIKHKKGIKFLKTASKIGLGWESLLDPVRYTVGIAELFHLYNDPR
jgi:hypothetical protein